MPYDGTIGQEELEQRSEQVAGSIFNALEQMENFFEKVTSFADGRSPAQIAADMWVLDKNIDTTRFPTEADLAVFITDVSALAGAFNTIVTGVNAGNRADIVKFA